MSAPQDLLWRQGRGHLKEVNVYARIGAQPDPLDELVAIAATPELAARIVSAHNMTVLQLIEMRP